MADSGGLSGLSLCDRQHAGRCVRARPDCGFLFV